MVVENQHRMMRDLRKLTGLDIRQSFSHSMSANDNIDIEDAVHGDALSEGGAEMGQKGEEEQVTNDLLLDENYCTLLRLVGESIMPSDAMLSLQDHIRRDFDIDGFQQAMTMEEFWSGITLYMDQLHSMELFLLEELENCEGSYEELDLLSLEREGQQCIQSSLLEWAAKATLSNIEEASSLSQQQQQSALDAIGQMTQDELKNALVSFLTQGGGKTQSSSLVASPPSPTTTTSTTNVSNGKSTQQSKSPRNSSFSARDNNERPALEEWEISLYDVDFHKRIGRGSAGTTYLGKYCQQDVAVKVAATSDMGLEGWTAELMALKKLHHTNIIRFMGAIYNPSPLTYCLVLEYCNGGDLSVALAGSTPPKFFNTVASGVANGMYYLHKMSFMHRDIKPGNVLLSGDPKLGQFVAKLTDFGLSVKVQNVSSSVNSGKKELTAETGTYRYMAPEVIRHEPYNYAADVYSFGLLMWEIITREKPFENKSQIEAAGAVALEGKRPPFPYKTPLVVRSLIEKCWAELPSERMEVKDIIGCLGQLGNDMTAESWLSAPTGHPVYKQTAEDHQPQYYGVNAPTQKNQQKKKTSVLKSGLFRKKKK